MNELVPTHETGSASLAEPLWKIRWKLIRRGIAQNWEIFKESRIGMLGIILIIAFGIFGAMWPIMINTVWDPMVYDPVVGFDPMTMHPSPQALRTSLVRIQLGEIFWLSLCTAQGVNSCWVSCQLSLQ